VCHNAGTRQTFGHTAKAGSPVVMGHRVWDDRAVHRSFIAIEADRNPLSSSIRHSDQWLRQRLEPWNPIVMPYIDLPWTNTIDQSPLDHLNV